MCRLAAAGAEESGPPRLDGSRCGANAQEILAGNQDEMPGRVLDDRHPAGVGQNHPIGDIRHGLVRIAERERAV